MSAGSWSKSANAGLLYPSGRARAAAKPLQHQRDFAGRPRRAEQITLRLRAAFGLQNFELLLGLDAFGGRNHSEAAAQTRNRTNDRKTVVLIAKLFDERAVDLILSNGKLRR